MPVADRHPKFTVRQVRSLSNKELASASQVLGAAFKHDLFTEVITSNELESCAEFWSAVVVAGSIGGEVYFAETRTRRNVARVIGVAVWFPPGRELYDSAEQREKALAPVLAKFSPELQRWWGNHFLPKYGAFTDEVLGEGAKRSGWHLQAIATDPAYQRRGIARALMEVVRKQAAKKGQLLCLETENPRNLDIYTRLGWEVKGNSTMFQGLTGEFPMWVMIIEPPEHDAL
ncbi:hypothetical protein FA15DRAFT_619658 [Coprinopsis marcescibilis]|uniref:N-acetyltransferase domain-containing protein n=1 Tax=Coprinopsis marcescibilis TaxID=230819 RepID=A0A5C3KWH9_COPMA|nr:hypothetical protein FA15DRAFT_619658 [Coprinopsis marcescibilis]